MKAALVLALATMTLTACSAPPAPVAANSFCQATQPIYPPDSERPVLVRQAPVTARAIAGHNAAYEEACR